MTSARTFASTTHPVGVESDRSRAQARQAPERGGLFAFCVVDDV